jgi:hypothetical protein
MTTSACTRPSSSRCSSVTVAPNAAFTNAMTAPGSRMIRYGVTAVYPSGIGWTGHYFGSLFSSFFRNGTPSVIHFGAGSPLR